MERVVMLAVIAMTSIGACLVGAMRLRLTRQGLRAAVWETFESVGTGLVFFIANLALGVVLILGLRAWMNSFVSAYVLDDVAWLMLSLLQGLLFHWWRELSIRARQSGRAPRPVCD